MFRDLLKEAQKVFPGDNKINEVYGEEASVVNQANQGLGYHDQGKSFSDEDISEDEADNYPDLYKQIEVAMKKSPDDPVRNTANVLSHLINYYELTIDSLDKLMPKIKQYLDMKSHYAEDKDPMKDIDLPQTETPLESVIDKKKRIRESVNEEVSKEDFEAYVKVQQGGKYNMMMDSLKAMSAAGLDKGTYFEIIKNYGKYKEMYSSNEAVKEDYDEDEGGTTIHMMINGNERDLIDIASTKLGWAVAEQFEDIIKKGDALEDKNSNALRMILDWLDQRGGEHAVANEIRVYLGDEAIEEPEDMDEAEDGTDEEKVFMEAMNNDVDAEDWPSCGNCGKPVNPEVAKKNVGFCPDCDGGKDIEEDLLGDAQDEQTKKNPNPKGGVDVPELGIG